MLQITFLCLTCMTSKQTSTIHTSQYLSQRRQSNNFWKRKERSLVWKRLSRTKEPTNSTIYLRKTWNYRRKSGRWIGWRPRTSHWLWWTTKMKMIDHLTDKMSLEKTSSDTIRRNRSHRKTRRRNCSKIEIFSWNSWRRTNQESRLDTDPLAMKTTSNKSSKRKERADCNNRKNKRSRSIWRLNALRACLGFKTRKQRRTLLLPQAKTLKVLTTCLREVL